MHGEVYVLGKDFLVNLAGGRFAKLGVALIVEPGSAAPAEGGAHGERLKKRIVATVKKKFDVHIEDVLLTDVAVQ